MAHGWRYTNPSLSSASLVFVLRACVYAITMHAFTFMGYLDSSIQIILD